MREVYNISKFCFQLIEQSTSLSAAVRFISLHVKAWFHCASLKRISKVSLSALAASPYFYLFLHSFVNAAMILKLFFFFFKAKVWHAQYHGTLYRASGNRPPEHFSQSESHNQYSARKPRKVHVRHVFLTS